MVELEGVSAGEGGQTNKREEGATEFARQAEHLALEKSEDEEEEDSNQPISAKFITPLDPVIETAQGGRLPVIPVEEANKLNRLKKKVEDGESPTESRKSLKREGNSRGQDSNEDDTEKTDTHLGEAIPPSRTNPLFPPLPIYGPPTTLRSLQCIFFRVTSSILSFGFLLVIFAGAMSAYVPSVFKRMGHQATLKVFEKKRPFYEEEMKRKSEREAAEKDWIRLKRVRGAETPSGEKGPQPPQDGEFVPTEGGPDRLCVDPRYYARRVGLDCEIFEVQTEDGFIIELWHLFNPREYKPPPPQNFNIHGPNIFETTSNDPRYAETQPFPKGSKKYPVLMIHGLLQSSGAFCCNEDDSLAFYLAKSGYDVWLGNNRSGFGPKHTLLKYNDPRMWAWNIRQMGVLDLPALISRVLAETGFPKLALIAHSQGTTETFVALAKEQRPDIGNKISVFCALAPAVYAGPLISKIYFKFMRLVSPSVFRLIFGIHAFIPFMMFAHLILPARPYSWLGYHVFSYLFNWSDTRWDCGLRDRMFQWAPVYVSAESMRWWLGRECFAKQKCILATYEEGKQEDKEDEEDDEIIRKAYIDHEPHVTERKKLQRNVSSFHCSTPTHLHRGSARGKFAWYDEQFPPLALWVAGADDLVDGRRLLRRFDRGREPHVRVVHQKIIEGYEHLDVIWAMDAIEKVGKEVREVIWRTIDRDSAAVCRTPVGCQKPLEEDPDLHDDVPMLHSGGRLRMASISEMTRPNISFDGYDSSARMDATIEVEGEHDHIAEEEREYNDDKKLSDGSSGGQSVERSPSG